MKSKTSITKQIVCFSAGFVLIAAFAETSVAAPPSSETIKDLLQQKSHKLSTLPREVLKKAVKGTTDEANQCWKKYKVLQNKSQKCLQRCLDMVLTN